MAIQKHYADNTVDTRITKAQARVIAKTIAIGEVLVVLDGSKKEERILPYVVNYARENNAELVIIYAYASSVGEDRAALYIKTVRNKLRAQYSRVTAYLYRGTNAVAALDSVIDDRKQSCVMLPATKPKRLQGLSGSNTAAQLSKRANLIVQEVNF